jgi:hypothetical protein
VTLDNLLQRQAAFLTMASKFKMSNGTEGMLKGQAGYAKGGPDAFQKVDPSMPNRSKHDTEHEKRAIGPTAKKAGHQSTGFTSKCAGLAQDGVMEQAIQDKLTETMKAGIEDGWNARLEAEDENQEVTQEQIDAAEDDTKNDDDDSLEAMRAKRRQQMKEAHEKRLKYQGLGHGTYDEIEEEAFLKTVTASPRCIVHFYHKNFEKCKIMDMHLRKMPKKFCGNRFERLDAEKAPNFVEKLNVKTLPCVVVFNDGVAKGRQTGFEGLGGEEFKTIQLAFIFKMCDGIEENFEPEDEACFD